MQTVEDAIRAWRAPAGQRVQRTEQYHARQSTPHVGSRGIGISQKRAYTETYDDYCNKPLASTSSLASASTSHRAKRYQPTPDNSSSQLSLLTSAAPVAITAHGLTIRSPDPKGKGKALTDDEDMEVDPSDVPLPGEEDAEGELEEYPEGPQGEKEEKEKEAEGTEEAESA